MISNLLIFEISKNIFLSLRILEWPLIEIRNNGIGMSPKDLEDSF